MSKLIFKLSALLSLTSIFSPTEADSPLELKKNRLLKQVPKAQLLTSLSTNANNLLSSLEENEENPQCLERLNQTFELLNKILSPEEQEALKLKEYKPTKENLISTINNCHKILHTLLPAFMPKDQTELKKNCYDRLAKLEKLHREGQREYETIQNLANDFECLWTELVSFKLEEIKAEKPHQIKTTILSMIKVAQQATTFFILDSINTNNQLTPRFQKIKDNWALPQLSEEEKQEVEEWKKALNDTQNNNQETWDELSKQSKERWEQLCQEFKNNFDLLFPYLNITEIKKVMQSAAIISSIKEATVPTSTQKITAYTNGIYDLLGISLNGFRILFMDQNSEEAKIIPTLFAIHETLKKNITTLEEKMNLIKDVHKQYDQLKTSVTAFQATTVRC